MAVAKVKVYELAKKLGMDAQALVEVVQRLGIDIKTPTSVLGTEEVKSVKDFLKKHQELMKSSAPPPPASTTRTTVTEKRVGATVIRRRAKTGPAKTIEPEEVIVAPEEEGLEVEAVELSAADDAPTETEIDPQEFEASDDVEVTEEASGAGDEPVLEGSAEDLETPVAAKPVGRRVVSSIIKKMGTEEYLGAKVGPKVVRPVKKPKPVVVETTTPTSDGSEGPRRIREVDLGGTDLKADAGRKKVLERQSAVFRSSDYLKRELIHSTRKKKVVVSRPALRTQITTPAEHKRVVEMGESISVAEFAKQMGVKAPKVIAKLLGMGVEATMNQSIDFDSASLVAPEFKFEVKQVMVREGDFVPDAVVDPTKLVSRGPIVTIMGHVDHGKTSLLDYIRKSRVAQGEAGGITQHVGAYTVELPKGRVTFIDTPGHEAFTAMRARGAKVTDVVILVVSAVDGVMPQTLESIDHAKAAKVTIIVAVNKIDLPDANPDRIKQTLAGHGLSPEEWGGDTLYVNVSAKTGKGVDELLDSILLQSEMLELKAVEDAPGKGTVIESRLDKQRGSLATVMVQHGTFRLGDMIVVGNVTGKIRAMTDSLGRSLKEARPSQAIEILGLASVPNVGDDVQAVANESDAKALVDLRVEKQRATDLANAKGPMTLEEMLAASGNEKELKVILKADVQGSLEAIREAIGKLPSDKVKVNVIHTGPGGVTESDVMLASASKAAVVGFNVRPDLNASRAADRERVEIKTYTIIYDLLEDMRTLMAGLLDAKVREKVIGRAEVRDTFTVPKVGLIAGSAIIDGKVTRGCYLRVLRDSRVIYEGKISSLRRFKDDVKEVASGFECGIGVENFHDIKAGDHFEAFIKEEFREGL